jgi:membrane protein
MGSSKGGGREPVHRWGVPDTQLTVSRSDPLPRPALKYVGGLLRNPISLWISLGAIFGWISTRLLPERRSHNRVREFKQGEHYSQKIPSTLDSRPEKRLTLLSMGLELLVAVGAGLLKRQVKSWSTEIDLARKRSIARAVLPKDATRASNRVVKAEPNNIAQENWSAAQRTSKRGVWTLLKTSAVKWMEDKCPQTGAALAYFTVFSLAPLVLILLAFFGLFFGSEHARDKIIEQLQYMIDPSGIKVIKDIAASAAKPRSGIVATIVGVVVGLFGASGVFGQLQDALNTIWGVKAKPGTGLWTFLRARFLSFAMVAGVCFLLLVSLIVESILRAFSAYLQNLLPGGHILALSLFFVLDLGAVILLFAMIFRFLPDVKIAWNDVWIGASLTAVLFVIGKFLLGLYLGSGAAGSAYGAASSLITLLLWIYYSAQILLYGAEFTHVYASTYGSQIQPEEHAVRVVRSEVEVPRPTDS